MQKFLGYIICNNVISDIPFFISKCQYSEIGDALKSGMPVLIVGYDIAKDFFKEKFNILNKCIDGIYWTFFKREKRVDFEDDIDSFYKLVIGNAKNNITYRYANIFKFTYSRAKNLINFINSDEKKYIYYCNGKMIYIYCRNTVIGFSIESLEYIGLKIEKVDKLIRLNKENFIFNKKYLFPFAIRKYIRDEYLIPFFYSINN